jgi:hypothetical protein
MTGLLSTNLYYVHGYSDGPVRVCLVIGGVEVVSLLKS